ncbi:MAG: FHA domain-containing protein [Planctomycetaceae bacterium]
MSGAPPAADAESRRRRSPMEAFAAECGLRGPLRFMAENTETGQSQTFDVFEPFVLIGRSPGCHLQLLHPEVCFRHAYCQVIEGRLYVFDLDSQNGTGWGSGLQHEGVLTPQSRLHIGPFVVRLSRAPAFTQSLEAATNDWELENEPLENVRLWFENATGRSSNSALRPLRRRITILGRSNRSHLKLSDASVSKAHCAIVRTGIGFWVVDLLGRSGTTLNDRSVRMAPVGPADRIGTGRFRLRIREVVQDHPEKSAQVYDTTEDSAVFPTSPPAISRAGEMGDRSSRIYEETARVDLIQAQNHLSEHAQRLGPDAMDGHSGSSDALILAMMEQFSHLQRQLLTHTQQQMSMLTEMFATLHKAQNNAVMEQLSQIQAVTAELNALRAERLAVAGREVTSTPELSAPTPPVPEPELSPSNLAPDWVGGASRLVSESPASTSDSPADQIAPVASDIEAATDESDVVLAETDSVSERTADEPSISDEFEAAGGDVRSTSNTNRDQGRARAHVGVDAGTHARLTMRIGELERERNSRWKRLMQLVSGGKEE